MGVDFNTRGLDWRTHVRQRSRFVCLVDAAWHRNSLCQRQLAYARQLGKPIYFLLVPGQTAPAREGEHVVHVAHAREAARVLMEMLEGER